MRQYPRILQQQESGGLGGRLRGVENGAYGEKFIIVSTICKFQFIQQTIGRELKEKKFWIIIDEAIEEGFIDDVVSHYMPYQSYYKQGTERMIASFPIGLILCY